MDEELKQQVANLRGQVDLLIGEKYAKKPWYKEVPTLIAVAAFLFSLVTTVLSYTRSNEQDVQSLKAELRSTVQRLTTIPRDQAEVVIKFKNDAIAATTLTGFLQQEMSALAQLGNDLIKRIPPNRTSAVDHIAIANALSAVSFVGAAVERYNSAQSVSVSPWDDCAALWGIANIEMAAGKAGDARVHLQQALDIVGKKYPGTDALSKSYMNAQTELNWAAIEAAAGNVDLAIQHLNNSDKSLAGLSPNAQIDAFKVQVAQMRATLTQPQVQTQPQPSSIGSPAPVKNLPLPKSK